MHEHPSALANPVEEVLAKSAPERQLRELIRAILARYGEADAEHKLQIDVLGALPEAQRTPLFVLQRRVTRRMRLALSALGLAGTTALTATMTVFGILKRVYMWHRPDAL